MLPCAKPTGEPEDLAGYRALSREPRVSIAGGEAHLTGFGFDRFIAQRRPAINQPDISCCGVGGYLAIPDRPGLGIEMDERALRSFCG